MKKWNALVVLLVFVCAAPSTAQTIWVGARGGLNIADFEGDDVPAYTSRKLPNVGLYGAYPLASWLALESEVALTRKGSTLVEDRINRWDYALSYIEVPVLARLQYALLDGRVVPHVLAGPAAALRVGCGISGLVEGFSFDVACDHPALGNQIRMREFDFGVMFGGGLDFGVPGGVMTLDARYDHGLTDIDKDDRFAPVRNRVLSFTVGFARPLDR